jgi:hypothetical protein
VFFLSRHLEARTAAYQSRLTAHVFTVSTERYTYKTMLGEEEKQDFVIETADAGASATIPMDAGEIKKGGYVFIMLVSLFDYSAVACFDWNLLNICVSTTDSS